MRVLGFNEGLHEFMALFLGVGNEVDAPLAEDQREGLTVQRIFFALDVPFEVVGGLARQQLLEVAHRHLALFVAFGAPEECLAVLGETNVHVCNLEAVEAELLELPPRSEHLLR